eukprot:2155157-Rhodomonas_salina.2
MIITPGPDRTDWLFAKSDAAVPVTLITVISTSVALTLEVGLPRQCTEQALLLKTQFGDAATALLLLVVEEQVLDPRLLAHRLSLRLHNARRDHLGERLGRGTALLRDLPRPERHQHHPRRSARRGTDDDSVAARARARA